MSDLTERDVLHVAALARLSLAPGEATTLARQMGDILDHFRSLSALDTEGVEPTSHAVGVTNRFRDDAVRGSLPRETMMANAPECAEGAYRVPRVIEEGE